MPQNQGQLCRRSNSRYKFDEQIVKVWNYSNNRNKPTFPCTVRIPFSNRYPCQLSPKGGILDMEWLQRLHESWRRPRLCPEKWSSWEVPPYKRDLRHFPESQDPRALPKRFFLFSLAPSKDLSWALLLHQPSRLLLSVRSSRNQTQTRHDNFKRRSNCDWPSRSDLAWISMLFEKVLHIADCSWLRDLLTHHTTSPESELSGLISTLLIVGQTMGHTIIIWFVKVTVSETYAKYKSKQAVLCSVFPFIQLNFHSSSPHTLFFSLWLTLWWLCS